MKKHFLPLLVMIFVSVASFGQSTRQKTDQLKTEPLTTENAARADARLLNKKIISDTTMISPAKKSSSCRPARKKKRAVSRG